MVWLPMFGIFNVRTDADACDCTRGLYGHRERVCTGSWLWEKKPMPHLGLEPASVLRLAFQSDALPAELFPTLCFVLAAVAVFFLLPLSLFPCFCVPYNTTAPRAWVLVSGYWALYKSTVISIQWLSVTLSFINVVNHVAIFHEATQTKLTTLHKLSRARACAHTHTLSTFFLLGTAQVLETIQLISYECRITCVWCVHLGDTAIRAEGLQLLHWATAQICYHI